MDAVYPRPDWAPAGPLNKLKRWYVKEVQGSWVSVGLVCQSVQHSTGRPGLRLSITDVMNAIVDASEPKGNHRATESDDAHTAR